ncbi:MAG: hypothetical protein OEY14_18105, partial [Myxococcales bacterium]|nr:hypothetical protein [Myxococcales bacterium]
DGFDGNNAPRCEIAAYRLDRLLFGDSGRGGGIVPPTVLRAFHRDIPCDRRCAALPRLRSMQAEPTFPELNDHLVLGALASWIEGASMPPRYEGGLWDGARYDRDPVYRRAFSDLVVFLFLIQHGDANYDQNFLASRGYRRLYSIDNGRAFDGVPFYVGQGDPDWRPFEGFPLERLPTPSISRQTLRRLSRLRRSALEPRLRIAASMQMASGRGFLGPGASGLGLRPLGAEPALERRGRGLHLGEIRGDPWVLLGLSEPALSELEERARALEAQVAAGRIATF